MAAQPIFYVNGVAMSETEGASIVYTTENSFTFSWSGLIIDYNGSEEWFSYTIDSATITDGDVRHYTVEKWGDKYVEFYAEWGMTVTYIPTPNSSGSKTIYSDRSLNGLTLELSYTPPVAYGLSSQTLYVTFLSPTPSITSQPSIISMNPSSGQKTTITWSSATVTNQGDYSIYYQYFVGPSSTYSDSYYVGTTASLSATITEANILANCGSSFDGTCYVFVRAYWTDGTTSGGWSTPSGKAFIYTPHRTIKYYNGNSWVECIPYYYNGSGWVECIPYYYDGTSWAECSH